MYLSRLTLAKRKGWKQKHANEAETQAAAEGAPHLPRFFSDETEYMTNSAYCSQVL